MAKGKKISIQENHAGGIDLLTERDAGNQVLIMTGKKSSSIAFWKSLKAHCNAALEQMGVEES